MALIPRVTPGGRYPPPRPVEPGPSSTPPRDQPEAVTRSPGQPIRLPRIGHALGTSLKRTFGRRFGSVSPTVSPEGKAMSVIDFESGGTGATVPPVRWRAPDTLLENLQLIADGVVAMAGFAVAAIRIRRGDELELVVDTGLPEEIGFQHPGPADARRAGAGRGLGTAAVRPARRGRQHLRAAGSSRAGSSPPTSPTPGTRWTCSWLRCTTPTACCAAPWPSTSRSTAGCPDLERRRVLEKFAVLAARAVLASVERESLAEQVAMADTVKAIVRTTSAQLSLERTARGERADPARRLRGAAALDQDRRRRRPVPHRLPAGRPRPSRSRPTW